MTDPHSRRRRGRLLVVSLMGVALVAAACGSSSKSTTPTTGASVTTAKATASTAAGTTAAAATTLPAATTLATVPAPKNGGKLTVGVEADSANPWTPAGVQCAAACYVTLRAVYDNLVMVTDKGDFVPYLAKSISHSDDYLKWTIIARDGVKFHDGTPLDGAAMIDNFTRQLKSALTGAALRGNFAGIAPNGTMGMDITFKTPWVPFPVYLAGQIGFIASPTWLKAVDADPTQATKPVGTGPFTFVDYKPGEFFKAKKNPDYWNKGLPYLDEVEMRPIPDALARKRALDSGDVDIIHTTNGDTIKTLQTTEKDKYNVFEGKQFGETSYTMLNVGSDPNSPLADQRVRCALANSQDIPVLIEKIQKGTSEIAAGPFSPGQLGYNPKSGYPLKQDMAKAKELIASYKKDHPGKLTISLATTQDETNLTIAQAQKAWWEQAGVDEVTIDQYEQGKYITVALGGAFQAFQWRNHGGIDLDAQYIWWTTENTNPPLALNFGRIKDPKLDALLLANRGEKDPVKRKDIAEQVNKLFADQCYNLWLWHTQWDVVGKKSVIVGDLKSPEGTKVAYGNNGGGHFFVGTTYKP